MPRAPRAAAHERVAVSARMARKAGRRCVQSCGASITIEWRGLGAARLVEFVYGAIGAGSSAIPPVRLRLEETGAGRLRLCRDDAPVYEDDQAGIVAGVLVDEGSRAITAHSGGGLLLHAAGLGWEGRGILIPAPAGAGKTTLAAWLTGAGLDYVTDDLSFVPERTRRLEGFARPLRLREGSEAALSSRPDGWPPPGDVLVAPGARIVSATALRAPAGKLDVALVLFAAYDPAGDGRLTPVSRAQTAFRLMGSLLNAGNIEGHGFDAAVDLAASTEALAIRHRDCRQVETALRDWRVSSDRPI